MLPRLGRAAALCSLALLTTCKDSTPPPDTTTLQYDIVIRFFGTPMSAQQQALFTTAAARITQIIKGDLVASAASAVNLNQCPNVTESIPINEQIDDVLIYASIRDIDGAGNIIASAGPCFTRPTPVGDMTAIGVMSFDSADLQNLTQGGNLQDVITHEMLHVMGIGTLWISRNPDLVTDTNTTTPKYTGVDALAGCRAVGATIACANFVPVEGTPEPPGTRDAHWRENTFNQEMMTGRLDNTAPISAITVGGLKDLGFTVDDTKADAFTVPPGGFLPSTGTAAAVQGGVEWEHVTRPVARLERGGVVRVYRK
jgi:hypothetical protein